MAFPGTTSRRLVALAAALAFGLPAAPAAAETLALEFDHVDATDAGSIGSADGVLGGGDTVSITPHLLSSNFVGITGLSGILSAPETTVSVLDAASAFTDVTFGGTSSNTEPLRFHIPAGFECGRTIPLSLALTAGADDATIPFTVGTGLAGAPVEHEAGEVPLVIPSTGAPLESSMTVVQPGRVKDLRVRIGRITHPYVEDLRIELVHPDGTVALLADHIGGSSDDFVDTVFAVDGASVAAAPAPRSGVFGARDLAKLVGKPITGTWRLRITDQSSPDSGTLEAWGADLSQATCVAQPIASFTATPNPVSVGGTVSFNASASSDPIGTITSYQWDLDGNGSYETDTGTVPTVTRQYTEQDTLEVKLRIIDDNGLSATQTKIISVTTPPVAAFAASPATPLTGQTVTLDGSGSTDPDGTVTRWQWDLDGNGSFERDGGSTSEITTVFTTPGDKIVRLRVTDNRGATAVTARTIAAGNRPPVAAFTAPQPMVSGVPVTLDGSTSTDPDGEIALYTWDLDGNGSFETAPSPSPSITHTFASPGSVTVGLRVTDELGLEHILSRSLAVTAAPVAVLGATPQPARPNQSVTFSAAGSSDADGTIVRHQWDLDGDGTYELDTGATPTAARSYTQPVVFTARLRVTDDAGATAVATTTTSVVNLLPSAVLAANPSPAIIGTPTTFEAGASADPDGTIVRHEWDLDGVSGFELDTGAASSTSRVYPNLAVVTVRVRVTDAEGGQAVATLPLTVSSAPPAPAPPGGGTTGGGTTGGGTTGGTTPKPGTGTTTPGTGSTPGGSGTTTGTAPGRVFAAGLTGEPIQKLGAVLKRGAPMTCLTDREARCTLVAEILPREAQRLKLQKKPRRGKKAKALRLGKFTVVARLGAPGALKVRVPAKWRRKLSRARTVSIVVRGTATDAKGTKIGLSRALLLRR